MIPFFSTSAPHYHTDICPNDRYNACAHRLAPTWAPTRAHTLPVTLPLSNAHLGHFTLSKPLCTTNGPSLTAGPFCFAPSSPLFLTVWCSLMDANGHLLNWINSQDRDKRGTAFFWISIPLPKFILSLSSAVCEANVNEEGQGDAATAGLIQNYLLQPRLHSHTMRGRKLHGPHVWQCLSANLLKCLQVMQLMKCPIKMHHTGSSSFGTWR